MGRCIFGPTLAFPAVSIRFAGAPPDGGVAGELGFEPRQAESESAVLPLDDSPKTDLRLAGNDSATRRLAKPHINAPAARVYPSSWLDYWRGVTGH